VKLAMKLVVKLAAVAVVLLLSIPALADNGQALAGLCSQLIGSQVGQCQAAAAGRHIDPGAAQVCAQLIGSQVIQCVSVIAGKDYNRGEQSNCSQLIGSQVVQCLSQTGRPHMVAATPPPPPPQYQQYPAQAYPPRRGPLTVAEIRAEVAAALESLRADDSMGADRRLRRLLNDLR